MARQNRYFVSLVALSVAFAAVAVAAAFILSQNSEIPAFEEVQQSFVPSEQIFVDRKGRPLHEKRVDAQVRRLEWASLGELPKSFEQMVLEAEDRRFYWHFGVDPLAVLGALKSSVLGASLRGTSTISMQVADLIQRQQSGSRVRRRSFREKIKQVYRAVLLERIWSKEQILEAYFNLIYYRGELQGIAAASQGLFGKQPMGLIEEESALLASLIRSPNATVEKVVQRACRQLSRTGKSCDDHRLSGLLSRAYEIRPAVQLAPHLPYYFRVQTQETGQNRATGHGKAESREQKRAARVDTSLDLELQNFVIKTLQRQVTELKKHNLTEAAAVVIENETGQVLAYVGNVGALSAAPYVDAARALRQAGSTLKPFIFGMALDQKLVTAATLIPDVPTEVVVASGVYRPQNYDRKFRDRVSVRVALASSLNIPAVRVLESVGVDQVVQRLKDLGLSELNRPDFYGPSIALGSADVKLIELTNAYRALANGGVWSRFRFTVDSSHTTNQAEDSRPLFSEQAAFIVNDILSDRGSRGTTFGWENPLGTRYWSAVKTGTSKDMRDNWCIGFSNRYTVGVWAGNLNGEPMWRVSGVQGAAPAWLEIMNELHKSETSEAPQAPKDLVRKVIRFGDSKTKHQEWFIAGTEPVTEKIELAPIEVTKLLYPLDQMLIALDREIPLKNQRMSFSVQYPKAGQSLRLNGQKVGQASHNVIWSPVAGTHKLELVDENGRVLDRVSFQVR